MTPEALDALAAADKDLIVAHAMLSMNFWGQAARMAYYARFHAAQAPNFERTGKVTKTHKGVRKEFHGLAKADAKLPSGIATELTKTYIHKEIADYDTGKRALLQPNDATVAIATAERFVAAVRQALTAPQP